MTDAEAELRDFLRSRLWDNDPFGMEGAREIEERWSLSDSEGRRSCTAALRKIALERDRGWATALRALALIGASTELRDLFTRYQDFEWRKQVAVCLVSTEDPANAELCLRFAEQQLGQGNEEAMSVLFGLLKQTSAEVIPVLASYLAQLPKSGQAKLRWSMPGMVDAFLNQPDLLRSLIVNLNGQNQDTAQHFSVFFEKELNAPWRLRKLSTSLVGELRDQLRS